jgi:hypothetical protein
VVAAAPGDPVAAALAKAWKGPSRHLTTADFSEPGWRFRSGRPEAARLTIGEENLGVDAVAGIVNRIPWITPKELCWIAPEDRDYVACEMAAFWLAFLHQFAGPVLNRPSPTSLCGPNWRQAAWRDMARQAGFSMAAPHEPENRTVRVVGDRCLGLEPPTADAIQLARAAGTALLDIRLAGDAFISAHPWPDLVDDDAAQALVEAVHHGVGTRTS